MLLGFVDSHCHLDLAQFDGDRDQVLSRAREAGVRAIVIPGIDVEQNRRALALADQHGDLFAAAGVHPNSSAAFDASTLETIEELASHPRVVAIGEIGLDFYWKDVEPAQQVFAFRAQLDLAARIGKPVIIHSRDANDALRDLLRAWVTGDEFRTSPLARRPFAGVLHAFSGDLEMAQEAYSWGFAVSLGGPVTFRNARELHERVRGLRLDRLMLETDAPYLTPHPHRGKRNEPAWVTLVCDEIARLQGVLAALVAQTTTAVAAEFFGLEAMLRVGPPESHYA